MNAPETGSSLLRQLEAMGFTLRIEGDQLRYRPATMDPELLERVREHKPELLKLLSGRSRRRPPDAKFESIRALLPDFWKVFRTLDGRCGLLWGISARGVMLDIGGFIYTVEPHELQRVEDG